MENSRKIPETKFKKNVEIQKYIVYNITNKSDGKGAARTERPYLIRIEDRIRTLLAAPFWRGLFAALVSEKAVFCRNAAVCMDGKRGKQMDTRVAIIGIIVEHMDAVEELNEVLHEYGKYIIGRMGIPYRKRNIHIISIAIDAPQDIISALSGKIGKLPGISAKTAYSNVISHES